jgi:ABC-2 type transport system permease protein
MVGAYSLVFRYLLRVTIDNYALFLFVGLTMWTFFMGGAISASQSLVANANLVKKVSFPRPIVPLAAMTGSSFTAGAMLVVALPLCVVLTPGSRLTLIMVPPLVLFLAALTVGFGLIVAAANVYFRDVEHILAAISLPWIFISPIFYSLDYVASLGGVSDWAIDLLHYANPVAPPMIALHDALFFGVWPRLVDVVYAAAVGPLVLAVGWRVFRRFEGEMAVEL